jgi:hypothetical protein
MSLIACESDNSILIRPTNRPPRLHVRQNMLPYFAAKAAWSPGNFPATSVSSHSSMLRSRHGPWR